MPAFHGSLGPQPPANWSVSALETYLGCPFKFFALHVLKLREEPDDEEVMDPRRQGALVHEVFEAFFKAWQQAGRGAITPENLDEARGMFERVVDQALKGLPPSEAGLERTRLLGSSAAAGLGDAVFRMEAERPVAVVERFLEHRLAGTFSIATSTGRRDVFLRGKADRLDLLEDGTFRLIDYKLGLAAQSRARPAAPDLRRLRGAAARQSSRAIVDARRSGLSRFQGTEDESSRCSDRRAIATRSSATRNSAWPTRSTRSSEASFRRRRTTCIGARPAAWRRCAGRTMSATFEPRLPFEEADDVNHRRPTLERRQSPSHGQQASNRPRPTHDDC